jgi:hypothetical protein
VSPLAMKEASAVLLDEKARALRSVGGGDRKAEANDWHDVSEANSLLEPGAVEPVKSTKERISHER